MKQQKSVDGLSAEERIKKCPDCGGEVVYEDGEMYCKKCGLVID